MCLSIPTLALIARRIDAGARQCLSRRRRMIEMNTLQHGSRVLSALLAIRLACQIPRILVVLTLGRFLRRREEEGRHA